MSNKTHIESVLRRWSEMRDLSVEWITLDNASIYPKRGAHRPCDGAQPAHIFVRAREGNNEGHVIELCIDGKLCLRVKTLGEDMTGAWLLGAKFAAAITQWAQGTSYAWRQERKAGVAA